MKHKLFLFFLFFFFLSCKTAHNSQSNLNNTKKIPLGQNSKIYPINKNSYYVAASYRELWSLCIDILIANYSLLVVDKASGLITTDWDSFRTQDALYRNKVTIRVKQIGWGRSLLSVHNTLETMVNGKSLGYAGTVWLPTKGKEQEVGRIIKNIAGVFGQNSLKLSQNKETAEAQKPAGRTFSTDKNKVF